MNDLVKIHFWDTGDFNANTGANNWEIYISDTNQKS